MRYGELYRTNELETLLLITQSSHDVEFLYRINLIPWRFYKKNSGLELLSSIFVGEL